MMGKDAIDETGAWGIVEDYVNYVCPVPGAEDPLFEVPEGRMAVGMG
ncbi:hypothetical protein IAE22_30535, partial [Bacillus sp. S34]|nr:hypothetical protein [Bacillus sp. S34]